MRNFILAAVLLSAPAFGASGILIQKGDQRYLIIPDCNISEDMEDIKVRRLYVGAPIHIKHNKRKIRCRIEEILEDNYAR